MLHDRDLAARFQAPETSRDEREIAALSSILLKQGYVVAPALMPPDAVAAIDAELEHSFAVTPFCEGGFYGEETKRFGRLLARSSRAANFVAHPTILGIAEQVLKPWCDTIQLNVTQAIAIHPGALPQLPHRDQDMWRGDVGVREYLINVMWPFTDYTAENGATLVWPHSHGARALDEGPASAPVVAEMSPGSALIFLGSTLHAAGTNCTHQVRRGMVVGYCLGWLKPYENQWLAYPPPVARRFSPELAALVGYRQHRPNLGNYEGQCPSVLLRELDERPLGAIDALRPDQTVLVEDYVDTQRRPA
uniref:phytanoyl-CoA dioxygenase family protein n=1 Tax=uncultured Sphingomonas sp. TaxID=158754 RepID=UPI0035CC9048